MNIALTEDELKIIENKLSSLPPQVVKGLLDKFKPPKQARTKVEFPLATININKAKICGNVDTSQILKHYCEHVLSDVANIPPSTLKANLIEMYEMLAEMEKTEKRKDMWRKRAATVVMLKTQMQLIQWVATLATGISTNDRK